MKKMKGSLLINQLMPSKFLYTSPITAGTVHRHRTK